MSNIKTRKDTALDDIHQLLGYYSKDSKGETLSVQVGLLMGWMSRLAATDWLVREELSARLEDAKKKYSSLKDT